MYDFRIEYRQLAEGWQSFQIISKEKSNLFYDKWDLIGAHGEYRALSLLYIMYINNKGFGETLGRV